MIPYRALQKTTMLSSSSSPSLRRILLRHPRYRSYFSTITSTKYGPPLLYTPKMGGPYHPIINTLLTLSGALCVLHGLKSACDTEEQYHVEKKAVDWGRSHVVEVQNIDENEGSATLPSSYDMYGTKVPGRPILNDENNGHLVLVRGLVEPAAIHHHGKLFGENQHLLDDTDFNLRRNPSIMKYSSFHTGGGGSTLFALPDANLPLLKLHRHVERYRWEEVFAGINISPYYYQDWSEVHNDCELFGNSTMCWYHQIFNTSNRSIDQHHHNCLESKTFACDSLRVGATTAKGSGDSNVESRRHRSSSPPTSFLLKSELWKHVSPDQRIIYNEIPKLSRCTTWPKPLSLPLVEVRSQPIWSQSLNAFFLPDGDGHFVLPVKTDGSATKPHGSLFYMKEPEIGDQRVSFDIVPPIVCSILAKQISGGRLVPYTLNSSSSSTSSSSSFSTSTAAAIDLVRIQPGVVPNAQVMFDDMEDISKASRRHGHLESSVVSTFGGYILLNGTASSPTGTLLLHNSIPWLYKVPFSMGIALINVGLSKLWYRQQGQS